MITRDKPLNLHGFYLNDRLMRSLREVADEVEMCNQAANLERQSDAIEVAISQLRAFAREVRDCADELREIWDDALLDAYGRGILNSPHCGGCGEPLSLGSSESFCVQCKQHHERG